MQQIERGEGRGGESERERKDSAYTDISYSNKACRANIK